MKVLNTFGPAPSSIEGMIYTTLPISLQLTGLPEVVFQALLLSAIVCYWVGHPEKRWLSWVMGSSSWRSSRWACWWLRGRSGLRITAPEEFDDRVLPRPSPRAQPLDVLGLPLARRDEPHRHDSPE